MQSFLFYFLFLYLISKNGFFCGGMGRSISSGWGLGPGWAYLRGGLSMEFYGILSNVVEWQPQSFLSYMQRKNKFQQDFNAPSLL